MRTLIRRTSFTLCDLALLILAAVVCSVGPGKLSPAQQPSDDMRSVSGTIASVQENGFTLTMASAISHHSEYAEQTTPKSITFRTDKNTTIDGKLRVGANAKVTYRQENGENLAINVRVGG
jgi:hypothetical protein